MARLLIRALRLLLRWRVVNDAVVRDLHEARRPYVHAFFHDQLLMMTYSYQGKPYGRRLAVLSSRHRDGEYVARTLEGFGHLMVRGSTSRGGVAGLKEMIRHLRAGNDAAFATDGPRGPRHRVQVGVIEAARLGRAPIVPVAFGASKKKLSVPGMPSSCRCRSRGRSSSMASRSSSRSGRRAMRWSGSVSTWSGRWSV
ncbi:MAG: lysophospholipid acyltransferase family protein [Candidatus Polarisedimenticolia bacterium]